MYCKNCGNKLNTDDKFCINCGVAKDNIKENERIINDGNLQNIKKEGNNKKNWLLSNLAVFIVSLVNILVLLVIFMVDIIKSTDSSGGSGFFLILIPFMPIIVLVSVLLPQLVGLILSGINLKIKKYKMLIFIFIASVISLLMVNELFYNNYNILFWFCFSLNIILSIIILLKLIFKIDK